MLEWLEQHQLPCLLKAIFGIDCPGCGFQRAMLYLLSGEWKEAVSMWPGILPLWIFIFLAALRMAGMKKISLEIIKNTGFVCLIIILISYLLRLIVNIH